MIIVGIDPGVTGAIAFHDRGGLVYLTDLPVLGGRVDGGSLAEIIDTHIYGDQDVAVYIENTQAMPKNGSIASHSLGLNAGIVIGVIETLRHPLIRVRPQAWKSKMGVSRMDKNAIRGVVKEIYPTWASSFARVKDHNRAEAVLISRYGVATTLQEANA